MLKIELNKIAKFVGSKKFFRLVMLGFVLESVWIALSASYPMAFDEDFHFGIIKLYARQWSPFFAHQPSGGNVYGALTSDPSFLFHYLMSFPYRLAALFTSSQMAQIITLRFIDIALVVCSLILFRKVLLKTKASPGLVNTTLLFFVLIPVVPLLAAQINYDDLLLPLAALAMLVTIQFKERLDAGTLSVGLGLELAAICMLASLVQFEFLPIFAAVASYVAYNLWRFRRQSHRSLGAWRKNWQLMRRPYRFAYLTLFLVALGLFGGRYGTNLVAYKTPLPQCSQVLSVAACSAYTPWLRNYNDELSKTGVDMNPLGYTDGWLRGMFNNSFFTSSSGADTAAYYVHIRPLPIISFTAIAVFLGGLLLFLRYWKDIVRSHPSLGFLIFVGSVYCAVLWLWNYHDFVHLGAAVALNGRYLFPVLPLFMLAIGLAYQRWLGQKRDFKVLLAAAVFILFLQGGGALTFIKASNPHWYWPGDKAAQDMNATAQKIVKPLVVG